ncbi:MAG: dynamin family protein [Streptosporangiaceae bacterium]
MEVPAEILRLGFELVDTPGVGSAIATNTAITRQFLPKADAVIFVTGFDSPLTDTEVSFLADAARHAGKLFLVLNKRDLVPDLLAARSTAWHASLGELLNPCLEHAMEADAAASAVDRLKTAQTMLEEAGRGLAPGWLERRAGEVLELLTGMVADQISILLQAARSPGLVGAEIAGLAGGDDYRGPGGWTADDVPGLAVRPPEWTVQIPLPRRFPRKPDSGETELRHRLADALTNAVSLFEASARARFEDAAQDWARRLDEQAASQAQQAAAYFRRCLRATPADEDLTALDDLFSRLASFQSTLGTWDTGPDEETAAELPSAASTQAGAGNTGGCVVCERMEAMLSEHLRHDQFRLATREPDQSRHALAGGFCPLHTWQYAGLASPLGISAGYAKLAASMADALEAIGQKGSTAGDLASLVAALNPRAGTCPLCVSLAEREQSVIAEITSGTPAEASSAALCLLHLALALAADPPLETGHAMVQALADALRPNADDMRAYALNREALRRGLLTEEESGAYLDALRRLAGLPALSRP